MGNRAAAKRGTALLGAFSGAVLFLISGGLAAQAPVAGQNINMVSGTQWPGGDPFLQRQNEPSLAVSSRNSLHLLAGANDYRTVDLPLSDTVPGSLAGDAWLGVFKSFDGGQTWQSYLLPGYPQDQSALGLASPLKAYSAAADPTVRAGTSGLFYYSGIAFNRGTNNGAVFVSTFFDANQKENGNAPAGTDTIQYQKTVLVDNGTSGQFLDKTWIAVDVPRAGAGTCSFTAFGRTQTFPAGNVYLVWSRFTGSQSTKIMFSRSLDCGNSWSNPIKLSESSSINQGTNIAIDPAQGTVYVAWRQFATSSNPDSILIARSDDFGATFPSKNTNQVATIAPFDQSTTGTRFRTNALPSIAASNDVSGKNGRVYVAWAQRSAANQDAQIVVSTSSNGGKTWSTPTPVDAAPLTDDSGDLFTRGHQFMPQITFAAGRLMVLYYDQRLDHTLSLFKPQDSPFLGIYKRTQALKGELLNPGGTGLNLVFTPYIDDDATVLPKRRHTIDLRVAEALPAATPAFTSASVSRYRMGLWAPGADGIFRDDENQQIVPQPPDSLYQLQVNAPNLPMFSLGTLPFLGDYVDIAGQNFTTDGTTWSFNMSPSSPPVFYATWTDNRDVVPPVDPLTGAVDWTKYTPPVSATNDGSGFSTSIYDPTKLVPKCGSSFTGSRNQNIYLSRISEGLLVGSPQDAKPLDPVLQRAFIVTLQNLTKDVRSFRLSIANQPIGGQASFLQTGSAQTLDLTINGGAGAARPVFVTSSSPAASVTVNVVETTAPPLSAASLGLSGFVIFNPEGSVSPLAQPDGTTVNIGSIEVYTPSFQVWNPNPLTNPNPYVQISNPNAALQNISNPTLSQNISNSDPAIQNISNQNISNQNISNPSPAIQNISNQNISNQNISNTTAANQNISNQNISNQNISNQNISNTPITDATYAVTNTGNTTHSYRIALYGNNPTNAPLQLIVTKNSTTPTAVGCTLQSVPQSVVLARSDAPVISTSLSDATKPAISDGTLVNGTVPIAPGETVFVTLRGQLTPDQMATLVQQLTPVITAHGANTGAPSASFALLLSIQTANNGVLPAAVVGTPYSTTLQTVGGTAPVSWTLVSGALPSGLTLSSGGTISGTPTGSGSFSFALTVTDSSPTHQSDTQTFSLTVAARKTSSALSLSPATVLVLQGSTATVTVADAEPTGTGSAPSGTVTVSGGSGITGGSCPLAATVGNQSSCTTSISATAAGTYTVNASYPGSSLHQASTASATLTANILTSSASLAFSSGTVVVGQPATVTATITNTTAGATTAPTGSVSFSSSVGTDTFTPASSCTLAGSGAGTSASCSVAVTAAAASPHVITVNYPGVAGVIQASTTTLTLTVNKRSTSTAVSVAPNPLAAGAAGAVSVTVTDTQSPGTPSSPWGTVSLSSSGSDTFSPAASCTLVAGAAGVSSCSASVGGTAVGIRTISASYGGSSAHLPSSSNTALTIGGATATTITSDSPAPSFQGQAVTVGFAVAPVPPATGTPTGAVTVTDGSGASCTAALPAVSCSIVPGATGTITLTATYSGDAFFAGSSGTRQHTVSPPYNFTGFFSPLAAAGTLTSPTNSGTGNFTKGVPVKWQLTDSSGNFVTSLTSTQTLQAVYYIGGVCTPGQATGQAFLLYQPTTGATGGSTFRYDPNNNQFLFNWSTKAVTTGPGCYELILQLNDGSAPKATRIALQ